MTIPWWTIPVLLTIAVWVGLPYYMTAPEDPEPFTAGAVEDDFLRAILGAAATIIIWAVYFAVLLFT